MKVLKTGSQKHTFTKDFKSVLIFSLIANAKKLGKKDLAGINDCIEKRQMERALKIVERKYSPRQWREYVEAQARPLLKGYVQEIIKV